jgi:hypothetical protein
MNKAITKAHTGICVGHNSMLMTPRANMTANSARYHHSGTILSTQEVVVSITPSSEGRKADDGGEITLWVLTHQASVDVWLFSQRPPSLLDNLFPEVDEGVDESSYSGQGDLC